MLPTLADVSAVLNALQGRWLPVYQEIDGQMVPKAEFANNVLELTGTEFKIIKNGTVASTRVSSRSIPSPVPWASP